MTPARRRWALSFADLCLLLLGFVLILHTRPDTAALSTGLRAAMGDEAVQADAAADALFEPGEAILSEGGRTFVATFAQRAEHRMVTVESRGLAPTSARLDAWELAAARTAALARALSANGIPANHLALLLAAADRTGQQLRLRTR